MAPTISSAARTRLALVAFASLWLSACGGGGGGDTVAAAPSPLPAASGAPAPGAGAPTTSAPTGGPATSPSPAAGPSTGPSPSAAPSPAPAGSGATSPASAFTAFAPTTIATGVQPLANSLRVQPIAVTRLSGGGGVVAWSSGSNLVAQRFGSNGAAIGPQIQIAQLAGQAARYLATTGLADGSWVVAWLDQTPLPIGSGRAGTHTLSFAHYAASGATLQGPTLVAGPYFGIFPRVSVRATADGGFAAAWSYNLSLVAPSVSFQRFDSNGAKVGPEVPVGGTGGAQTLPWLLALPDNSLEVFWLQRPADNSTRTVAMQHFDAQSKALGDFVEIAQSTAPDDYLFTAAVLTDGRIGVAWDEPLGAVKTQLKAFWAIVDTSGALQTPVGSLGVGTIIDGLDIAPAAGGGFTLFSQLSEGLGTVVSSIGVLQVNNVGAATGQWAPLASRTTVDTPASTQTPTLGPADTSFSVSGGSDGHYVVSYEAAIPSGAEVDVLGR